MQILALYLHEQLRYVSICFVLQEIELEDTGGLHFPCKLAGGGGR